MRAPAARAHVVVSQALLESTGASGRPTDFIPGSGILATSFPQLVYGQTSAQIGNITVETPEGNIVASKGGIVQIALGPVARNDATINLDAGSKNSDGTVAYVGNVDASGLRGRWRPGEHLRHGEYQWPGRRQRGRECERLAKCQRDGLVARSGHRERGRDGQRDHCWEWAALLSAGQSMLPRPSRAAHVSASGVTVGSGGRPAPTGSNSVPPLRLQQQVYPVNAG